MKVFSNTKECSGFQVVRIFHRCRNCWSRIHEDFIPELDNKEVSIFELYKIKID